MGRHISSSQHEEYIFLEATQFVVVVYQGHWGQKLRSEFTNAQQALDEAKKNERSLLYAITEVGRTAVFGHTSFERLEQALKEEKDA